MQFRVLPSTLLHRHIQLIGLTTDNIRVYIVLIQHQGYLIALINRYRGCFFLHHSGDILAVHDFDPGDTALDPEFDVLALVELDRFALGVDVDLAVVAVFNEYPVLHLDFL
jgi:hypothetical protein